ncbi:putative tRNA (guanine-N -)-methyltransferase [Rosellinia necatrix]|uniref:Putative tRNA (Guanine-N-)-methyltransferase n=1 Tax=Rosellinia necatrix TaxID=77044 RepID=A0A1W2TJS5_ROSNE|nr:putative tRNA (guanine-N -)-methyltransferase [Rosellinia necatrix]
MFDMRSTQPPLVQPAWPLHCDGFPGKSHRQRYRGGDWFPFCQGKALGASGYSIDQNHHTSLSQRLLQQIMDDQSLYQQSTESGDEACPLNDYFAENFPMGGTGVQNVRSQTTVQPVSLANCGRDVGPSHTQYSNKAIPGNERMFFQNHPATNAYAHDYAGSFNQQEFQYPSYNNPNGLCNPSLDVDFQHGFPPSTGVYPNMSVFAEPFEYAHVSQATLNSSFSSSTGSSIASERMASMTLEPDLPRGRTAPMNFRGHHHASSTGIQGQGWERDCPPTISPKMLRINPSPTPKSSSESIQTAIPATGCGLDFGISAWEPHEAISAPLTTHPNHKARKGLPTKPTRPRLAALSPLPNRESATSKSKTKVHAQQRDHQSPLRCLTEQAQARPIPKDHSMLEDDDSVGSAASNSAGAERDAKNRFLVESKLAGMTYREIRRQGGFTEAESTLRGRFRTLTKNKEQRVRKPEWQEKDIRLLKKAVRKLAKGGKGSTGVPWKQVAAYIYEHDGSYHFGNATCRKKWDELVKEGAVELP